MSPILLYRIAAVLFIIFAAAHTVGFLTFRAPSAEGRAVLESMNAVQFDVQGHSYSYGNFYRGFGFSCTVSMILSGFLAWHLGQLARSAPSAVGFIGWAFCFLQLPGVVFSFLYFGPPPMLLSTLVTVLLGYAAWLAGKQPATAVFKTEI